MRNNHYMQFIDFWGVINNKMLAFIKNSLNANNKKSNLSGQDILNQYSKQISAKQTKQVELSDIERQKGSIPLLLVRMNEFMEEAGKGFPILLPTRKLAYIPVGKVGQTTCKEFLFEQRTAIPWSEAKLILYTHKEFILYRYGEKNGEIEFRNKRHSIALILAKIQEFNNPSPQITNINPFVRIDAQHYTPYETLRGSFSNFHSFALIRNPLDRFRSNYKYFVFVRQEFEKLNTSEIGLNPYPSIEEFIQNIEAYEIISQEGNGTFGLSGHLGFQCVNLGTDPKLFTNLYRLEKISSFFAAVNDICQSSIQPLHSNVSLNIQEEQLAVSKKSTQYIQDRYTDDFKFYEDAVNRE